MGHLGVLALLVVDKACYMFVTVREDVFGEHYVLQFCGRAYSDVSQGKPKVVVESHETNLYVVSKLGS